MKKVVLILAIAMMWSAHAQAAAAIASCGTKKVCTTEKVENPRTPAEMRDCAKYSASDAMAATNADDNTFSATFSGVAERKGNSNADCNSAVTYTEKEVCHTESIPCGGAAGEAVAGGGQELGPQGEDPRPTPPEPVPPHPGPYPW